MIDDACINALTIIVMEVTCCSGLLQIAGEATEKASGKVPLKRIMVGIHCYILKQEWV